jgi:hypothetical protein
MMVDQKLPIKMFKTPFIDLYGSTYLEIRLQLMQMKYFKMFSCPSLINYYTLWSFRLQNSAKMTICMKEYTKK